MIGLLASAVQHVTGVPCDPIVAEHAVRLLHVDPFFTEAGLRQSVSLELCTQEHADAVLAALRALRGRES